MPDLCGTETCLGTTYVTDVSYKNTIRNSEPILHAGRALQSPAPAQMTDVNLVP